MLGDDLVLVRTGHVLEAAVGEHFVLLDRRGERSHVLNTSAAAVWHALDGAATVAEVCDALVGGTGGPPPVPPATDIAAQVRQVLAELVDLGLVHEAGAPQPPRPPGGWAPPTPTAGEHARTAARVGRPGTVGPLRVAGTSVLLDLDDPDVHRRLGAATTSLPAADRADHLVEVGRDGTGDLPYRIRLDGRHEGDAEGSSGAVAFVANLLDRLAAAGSTGHLCLHAGAVARDGRALVLAGPSGSGKSTLTAALVGAGAGYLTDELVAIDPDGVVVPYPKAIDLSAASCELLAVDAGSGTDGGRGSRGKAAVPPSRLGRVAGPAPVGAIVLLTGPGPAGPPPDGGLSGRLDPVDALVGLLPHAFGATVDEPGGLARLAHLVERVPVHRLERLDLATTLGLLGGLDPA